MEEKIKSTMKTAGWQEIRKIFEDEIQSNLKGIDTTRTDDIATAYIGRVEAEKILNNVLKKLDAIAYESDVKDIIYK